MEVKFNFLKINTFFIFRNKSTKSIKIFILLTHFKIVYMKIITLLFFCSSVTISIAQYSYFGTAAACPGNLNVDPTYPSGGGMVAGWDSILGPGLTTPVWSSSQFVPFVFNFNGAPVNSFKVSSTGVLTFDVASLMAAPSAIPETLPSANIPNKSICMWGLQTSGTNDMVHVKTFGSAPNRQHWIHYSSCANGTIAWSYYSIVLEETTNKIYIVDQRNTTGVGALTLGVQVNASTATMVSGSPAVSAIATTDFTSVDDYTYTFNLSLANTATNIVDLSFDVFPNPAKGIIHAQIELKNKEEISYLLFNSIGQVVVEKVDLKVIAGINDFTIDASKLTNGIYILKLSTSKGISAKQVEIRN